MLDAHDGTMAPRYPNAHAQVHSEHPLVLIGAVRAALRQSGASREELRRFTVDAFAAPTSEDLWFICKTWVTVSAEPRTLSPPPPAAGQRFSEL